MLQNKYNLFRRLRLRLYNAFPFARRLKGALRPLRLVRFRRHLERRRAEIAESVRKTGREPLFDLVEIETLNRCNGECEFCPVNRHEDSRSRQTMSEGLFDSIIGQLRALEYHGHVGLYSNNEPLLDPRIPDFAAKARRALPKAKLVLYSNGLLLTPELYKRLIDNLDSFVIDNYCEDFKLIPPVAAIHELASRNPVWNAKTRICVRHRREMMTSRGGLAPNRRERKPSTVPAGCTYPTRQMVIRPDGKLSLCCNDALGLYTLGDLSRESMVDAWYGGEYSAVRNRILAGRDGFDLCRHCDTYSD